MSRKLNLPCFCPLRLLWPPASLLLLLGALACQDGPPQRGDPMQRVGGAPELVGGSGLESDEIGSLSSALTNGTPVPLGPDDPYACVGIVGSGCTGTLIRSDVVLTAGHCVVPGRPSAFELRVRDAEQCCRRQIRSSVVIRHERYNGNTGRPADMNDLALVVLDQAVDGAAVCRTNQQELARGQAIQLVGFGIGSGSFGTKRVAANTIDNLSQNGKAFAYRGSGGDQGNTCKGDSGGPSFVGTGARRRVAGVHSTGTQPCGQLGIDMRVDAYGDWIAARLAEIPQLAVGSEPTCAEAPPRFDRDYCDSGCPCGEGEGDCDNDNECAEGLICQHDVGARYGVNPQVDVCERPQTATPPGTPENGPPDSPLPQPPPLQSPPAIDDASATAGEGQSCRAQPCQDPLTCVTVRSRRSGQQVGQYCMQPCDAPGSRAAPCNGAESCTQRSNGKGAVCFNPFAPQTGYTSPSSAPAPGLTVPAPDVGEGQGSDSRPPPASAPGPHRGNCDLNAMEARLLEVLNQQRAATGRQPVVCDAAAARAARAHSQDMCSRGYFSHRSPQGHGPADRLRAQGAVFRAAGENIAAGQSTAEQVHQAWMNSSGHRRNMLNGGWSRVGLGYVSCRRGARHYWTEVFMN